MKTQTRILDSRLYYTRKIELHRKGKKSRTVRITPTLICPSGSEISILITVRRVHYSKMGKVITTQMLEARLADLSCLKSKRFASLLTMINWVRRIRGHWLIFLTLRPELQPQKKVPLNSHEGRCCLDAWFWLESCYFQWLFFSSIDTSLKDELQLSPDWII